MFFYAPKELLEAYSNRTVRPASCPVHISFIFRSPEPKAQGELL